jgi:hypothetical protein
MNAISRVNGSSRLLPRAIFDLSPEDNPGKIWAELFAFRAPFV